MTEMTWDESDIPLLAGAAGTRVTWAQVPPAVRDSIQQHLGTRVTCAVSQPRGFSPALAARLRRASGGQVFVKAIGPDDESGAPGGQDFYRREARIASALPATVPSPRLIESWEAYGWVVLLLEDVDGRNPAYPWQPDELERVLQTLTILAESLTPSPLAAPRATNVGGEMHWRWLANDPTLLDGLTHLDPWVRANLEHLAQLENAFDDAASGQTLVHCDIRADNILLTNDQVLFVDWPHASIGALWLDLLFLLPSVAMQGGPNPHDVFWCHPLTRHADAEAAAVVLTSVAGYLIRGATQPPPPGLPTLRQFQLAQGVEAVRWLRRMIN